MRFLEQQVENQIFIAIRVPSPSNMKISPPLVTATAAQAASRLSLRASINGEV